MKELTQIQNELKVPKGNYNSFGKYKYRSAEDILEAVKPILLKHEASLVLSDEIVQLLNKYFVKSTAAFKVAGKEVNVYGYAELSEHKGMSLEQCTGTASSYARKYALNGLFLIDETEADADHNEVNKPTQKPVMTQAQFDKFIARLRSREENVYENAEKAFSFTKEQLEYINKIV